MRSGSCTGAVAKCSAATLFTTLKNSAGPGFLSAPLALHSRNRSQRIITAICRSRFPSGCCLRYSSENVFSQRSWWRTLCCRAARVPT